jgi:hypothetical protein
LASVVVLRVRCRFEGFHAYSVVQADDAALDHTSGDAAMAAHVYDGKRLAWTSCLTRIIQLKGKIDDQDYFELERVYELNSLANESLWNTDDLENKKSYLEYLGNLSILPADHLLLTKLYLNDN